MTINIKMIAEVVVWTSLPTCLVRHLHSARVALAATLPVVLDTLALTGLSLLDPALVRMELKASIKLENVGIIAPVANRQASFTETGDAIQEL